MTKLSFEVKRAVRFHGVRSGRFTVGNGQRWKSAQRFSSGLRSRRLQVSGDMDVNNWPIAAPRSFSLRAESCPSVEAVIGRKLSFAVAILMPQVSLSSTIAEVVAVPANRPPSMLNSLPVMYVASSDAQPLFRAVNRHRFSVIANSRFGRRIRGGTWNTHKAGARGNVDDGTGA